MARWQSALTTLLISCACLASDAGAQVDLDDGLVAYYPFSGDAADASGNGNDGQVFGATLAPDRYGNADRAYAFDGVSSYITIPSTPSLESPTTAMTLNAWYRADAWSSVGVAFGPLLMKSDQASNAFQYRLGVGEAGTFGAIRDFTNGVAGGPVPPFGEWHMATFVLAGNEAAAYYDGELVAAGVITAPAIADGRPLEIGRDVPGVIEVFDGVIDEVRVYGRALSEEEIAALYDYYEVPLGSVFLKLGEDVGVSDTVMAQTFDQVFVQLTEGVGVSDQPASDVQTLIELRLEEGIGVGDDAGLRGPDVIVIDTPGPTPAAGLLLTVEALGFEPFSPVQLYLESPPVLLGEGTADEFGRIRLTVTLPEYFTPGAYTLVLLGTAPGGAVRELRQAVTVAPNPFLIFFNGFEAEP